MWSTSAERLADELGRIVSLPAPHRAFARMDEIGVLGALVPQLEESRGLEQSAYHHRDVLGHTLEVVQHVVEVSADPEPIFRSRAARVSAALGGAPRRRAHPRAGARAGRPSSTTWPSPPPAP